MAQAGAGRIFNLLDEQPETDQWIGHFMNVEIVDGQLVETDKSTRIIGHGVTLVPMAKLN